MRGGELVECLAVDRVGKRLLGQVGDLPQPRAAERLDNILTGILHRYHLPSARLSSLLGNQHAVQMLHHVLPPLLR